MSKHRHEKKCCVPMYMPYKVGCSPAGYGECNTGDFGIKWFYALLILIVIVLQFGRKEKGVAKKGCDSETSSVLVGDDQHIDNSVLFIIVVFLLILCAGCFGTAKGCDGGYGF
ncbi:hypothetical protein OXPF_07100 [Oxobacter pfennigii]|uniref:Uncharacterized protein n=1 Tax=Oxobacter pfennigii TaxID=36849 RepID=A0A0P8Z015_9CLOT|nr:hypothetical protein [Oxobacter pfennigii]KPU45477.1 hypothetical protein OXPF_07100 [Oxobacter pfennigii]